MQDRDIYVGPVYGVRLIDSLPIGTGSMRQAMPDARDLALANDRVGTRVAAGFEVLLDHYRRVCDLNDELRRLAGFVCELDWSDNDEDAVQRIDDLRKALGRGSDG